MSYSEALRALADFIDSHPELPIGEHYNEISMNPTGNDLNIHVNLSRTEAADRAAVKAIIRALGGKWEKRASGSSMRFARGGVFGFFNTTIFVDRKAVCVRKVVGTEAVAVEAVEAAPAHTETRDVVEWDCKPLLGDLIA